MGLIIALIVGTVLLVIVGVGLYFVEFETEMNCKSEYVLKDGLVNELLHKATNNPLTEFEISNEKIKAGRFEIRKNYFVFWFPYCVHRCALPYSERTNNDDSIWGENIGYVTRFSSDWRLIKALHKSKSVNKELTQREKLNLNK